MEERYSYKNIKYKNNVIDYDLIKYVFINWDLVNNDTKYYLRLCGIDKDKEKYKNNKDYTEPNND